MDDAHRSHRPIALVVVLGSATPPGRLSRAVGDAVDRAAVRPGVGSVTLVDLAALRIGPAGAPPGDGDDTGTVVDALTAADAVILATPVYRASMTGVLKNLLDHVPVEALRDTPVGLVAMGASDHHYLGAERHLRDVLAFFGALVAPTAVYLTSADFSDGAPGEQAAGRLDALAETVVRLAGALAGSRPLGPDPLTARPS